MPYKLEQQWRIISEDQSGRLGMVYGRTSRFDPHGPGSDFDQAHEFLPLPEGDIFLDLVRDSCFIHVSSALLKRSAWEDIGRIPKEFPLGCDYFLFLEVAARYRTAAVQEVVCRYRQHGESLSHVRLRELHHEAVAMLDALRGRAPDEALQYRRRRHCTVIAFDEMCHPAEIARGFRRLVQEGSASYLLTRPFARMYRWLRRSLDAPLCTIRKPQVSTAQQSTEAPLLSVIIVSWKVKELLRDCLRSLHEHVTLPAGEWEAIVVDNASGDGSAEMVAREFPGVKLIASDQNLGFGRANNLALKDCRGEFVLLLNPDTLVRDDSLLRMVEKMRRSPEMAALGCCLLNPDGSYQRWTAGSAPRLMNTFCHYFFLNRILPEAILPAPLFLASQPDRDVEVGWVSGACMLLRRGALRNKIFDDRFFMYGEDFDLCLRLREEGWKVVYSPGAHVIHYGGRSIEAQTEEIRLSQWRSLRQVYLTHNRRPWAWCFALLFSVGMGMRSVLYRIAAVIRPQKGFEDRAARCQLLAFDAARGVTGEKPEKKAMGKAVGA